MFPRFHPRGWGFGSLLLLLLSLTTAPAPALAEEDEEEKPPEGWSQDLLGVLGFSQTEFENYAEGGESSLTWTSGLYYRLQLYRDGIRDWRTDLELEFGQTRLGDQGIRKAVDRIFLESVYTVLLDAWVDPYAAVEARTQFAKGFDYGPDPKVEVSRFANPLTFNQAAGLSRDFGAGLQTRLGVSVHQTLVTEERFAPLYTDDGATLAPDGSCPDCDLHRVETGIESVTRYERKFAEEKYTVFSELRLFSQFESLDKVRVDWRNKVSAQVLSFISVFLGVEVRYDEDIVKRTQLKQVLSIGLAHTFL